jgi:hypothetical protein
MAGKDLAIQVSVQDNASGAFKKIGAAGKQAAQDIAQSTTQASQGVNKLDSNLDNAAKSAKNFESAGRQIGVGLVGLGTAFTLYSRSVVDNQTQLATLQRTYGDAAAGLKTFADQIQATTTFSNDAAVASENIFGTLARNYGISADEIQRLIQVSADLAATSGLSLEDVSQRVASAIRGEAESAEALGLTMNQAAIDQDGLTLTMSNQEAAAFRLNALYDQVGFSTGAAAAQAETTAGRFKQLGNEVQDAAQSFVVFTGPIGQAVAGLSTFGLEAGLAVTGLASLAKGMQSSVSAAGGLRAALSSASNFIGPGGFLVAGLGLATVGAIALYKAFSDDLPNAFDVAVDNIDDVDTALQNLVSTMDNVSLALDLREGQAQFDSLTDTLNEYKIALDKATAPPDQVFTPVTDPAQGKAQEEALARQKELLAEVEAAFGSTDAAAAEYGQAQQALIGIYASTEAGAEGAQESIANLFAVFNASAKTPADFKALLDGIQLTLADLPNYTTAALEAAEATGDLAESIAKLNAMSTDNLLQGLARLIDSDAPDKLVSQWKDVLPELDQVLAQVTSSLTGEQLSNLKIDLADLIVNADPNTIGYVTTALDQLGQALASGAITGPEYAAAVDNLVNITLPNLQAQATVTGDVLVAMGERAKASLDRVMKPIDDVNRALVELEKNSHSVMKIEFQIDPSGKLERVNERLDTLKQILSANGVQAGVLATAAVFAAFDAQLDEAAKAVSGYSSTLMDLQSMGFSGPELDLAVNLQISQSSLDNANRVIIGQTQAMAQQLSGVKSWADTLIGDPGVWSDMDKLLADKRISAEQYTAAQEAQVSISQDVTNAQEDLKAIQVSLAPVMADAVRQQAEYIDGLQDQGPSAQLAALGMMDQATSTKALQLAQLAASATTGQMADSTEAMLEQAAAADPVLAALLQQMGLIDANGVAIPIDTSQADKALEATDKLAGAIGDLTDMLAQIFGIEVDDEDVGTANDKTQTLLDNLNLLDGTDANPDVNVDDNATGPLGGIKELILDIDGRHATTYVDTVYQSYGGVKAATGTTMHEYATGGAMYDQFRVDLPQLPQYATGGGHAIVGEYGPEMVWLPNGSQVTNHPATMSKLEAMQNRNGNGGDVNFYGPVTLQPAASDSYSAIRRAAIAGTRR